MHKGSAQLRVLLLLEIFRTQTDETHRMAVPDLAHALQERGVEVERKALYRDIDALMEYGADIRKTSVGYYLGERHFSTGELRLLMSAVQAASFISANRAKALMEKLLSQTSDAQADILRRQANIARTREGGDAVLENIETVNLAIGSGCRISFFYYKKDISKQNVIQRSGKSYHVSPYAMIWMQDRYYLVANMEERDELTHFRLDRMQNVCLEPLPARPCREVSEYVMDFDAVDYAAKCLYMFGGALQRITLRGDMSVVSDVLDRFGDDILITRDAQNEGRFLAYIQATDGVGLLGWVAQFGPALEIAAPEELRARMKERLEQACKRYC